jgi:hypothetical protein
MSFRAHYGVTGHHPVETPKKCLIFVYRAEVVLPSEVTMGSLRDQTYDEARQGQLWREDVDHVDERIWRYAIKNARYR